MKTIYTFIIGFTLALIGLDVQAANYCDTVGKPAACYVAQIKLFNMKRMANNDLVRKSNMDQEWKTWWFKNEQKFEQWVNTNCSSSACVLDQIDKHNNWAAYKLRERGVRQ